MDDIIFQAAGVDVSPGINDRMVELRVDEADIHGILDEIGLEDIFDHFGDEIIKYAKENYNLKEKE